MLSTTIQQDTQITQEALGAIRGLEMTHVQGFEAVQASLSAQMGTNLAHTELIRQDNSTIQEQILKVRDSARVAYAITNQKIENMAAGIARGTSGKKEQNEWDVQFMNIDVESLTLSILLMKETFRDALYMMCRDDEQRDFAAHVIWSEINKLLASSLEASASLATSRSRVPFVRSKMSLLTLEESAASHDYSSRVLSEERSILKNSVSACNGRRLVLKPFNLDWHTKLHLRMTPDGLLLIEMNCGVWDDGENTSSTRITFLPTAGSCRVGFVAHISVSLRDGTYPALRRQLYIVNIIPHKDGHPGAWDVVPKNEIREVQRPLSRDIDAPFDYLDDDTTILWVCPERFWRRIQRRNRSFVDSQFVQKSRDIITARCGSDVLSMVCGGRGAVETVPPPITPGTFLPGTRDLCIENESTQLTDIGDIITRYLQLDDKTFNFADYTSGASEVQSMMSLLSAAELGNAKPDGESTL